LLAVKTTVKVSSNLQTKMVGKRGEGVLCVPSEKTYRILVIKMQKKNYKNWETYLFTSSTSRIKEEQTNKS
jgi:hypothetical protein